MGISIESNPNEAQQQLVSIAQQKQQLARLSILLDEAFTVPVIGVRVGWDAIIGLIPVIGDGAGAIVSSYFVYKAIRFKMPLTTVVKMVLNIGVELLIGVIPLIGDVLDVAWKANRRNYRLMEGFFEAQEQELVEVCQQKGLAAFAIAEPKGASQDHGSRGHFVMLLVFVLSICSMLASEEQLEPFFSMLEHEIDVDAEIDSADTSQLEVMTTDIQP